MRKGHGVINVLKTRESSVSKPEYLNADHKPTSDVDAALQFGGEEDARTYIEKNGLGDICHVYTYDYDNPPSK